MNYNSFFLILQLFLSHKSESVQIKVRFSNFQYSRVPIIISETMLKIYPQLSEQKLIWNLLYYLNSKHLVLFLKEKRGTGKRGVSLNQIILKHQQYQRSLGSLVARLPKGCRSFTSSLTFLLGKYVGLIWILIHRLSWGLVLSKGS